MRQIEIAGLKVAEIDADGPVMASEADALDLMGEVYASDPDIVAIPTSRLPPDFFKLSTGLAGAVMQKFTNYGLRVAFVGDISAHMAASKPLADFVRETNARKQIMFVPDMPGLEMLIAWPGRVAGP
jgi:hypothetical protein